MNKVEYILNELPFPTVAVYKSIRVNQGVSLDVIKEDTGYSIVSIMRFIRTLKSAELIVFDSSNNHYYAK